MTFDMQLIHWPTVAAFAAYISPLARPSWCIGLTNHNTYRPDETQWRGVASMNSMRQTYINNGWTSGPNLYLAAEAPNPADIGIWQMTPITHQGTHAGQCNRDHLGIENVGDFNARPPSAAQYTLLLAVNRALLERWGIPPASVNVHNECMTGRTCPGKYLTGTQIRADLNQPWPRHPTPSHTRTAGPHGAIARHDYRAGAYAAAYFQPGTLIEVDDFDKNEYRHAASGIGFIADGDLQP